MDLRQYQTEAINAVLHQLQNATRPSVVSVPTGGGKSIIIAEICKALNQNILILQPSKELLEQNYAKLEQALGDDKRLGMYSASVGKKDLCQFTFATIGSIYRKPELFMHFDIALIDEAHLVSSANFNGMFSRFFRQTGISKIVGFTATPYRYECTTYRAEWYSGLVAATKLYMLDDMKPKFFDKIIYDISTRELIDQGFLSPMHNYIDDHKTNVLKTNSAGTDYTKASLDHYSMAIIERVREIVTGAYKSGFCNKMLIFVHSVDSAKEIAKQCDIDYVSGDTPKKERERIINEFKSKKQAALVNVNCLTTGFDSPDIDCILLARPTKSVLLYQQIVGRGLRRDPSDPNKMCKVIDITGTVKRFGSVSDMYLERNKTSGKMDLFDGFGRQLNNQKAKEVPIKRKNNY